MKSSFILWLTILLVFGASSTWQNSNAQCYTDLHDNLKTTSWLSCMPAPNPKNPQLINHWILYDLGDVYEINGLHFWNYNESGSTSQGIDQFEIDLSLDNFNWNYIGMYTLPQAIGNIAYNGNTGPEIGGVNARYLLITALDNYGGSCTGLSEIRVDINETPWCNGFDVSAHIHPNTCATTSNGKIELYPQGGEGPYSFVWNDQSTSSHLSGLPSGNYQVTIYDANYCEEAISVFLPDLAETEELYDLIPIPDSAYYDFNPIASEGLVAFDGNVGFYSSSQIVLEAGFEVVQGGNFVAEIEDCGPGNSNSVQYYQSVSGSIGFTPYTDYIGAGHTEGTQIWASSQDPGSGAFNTLGGQGLIPDEGAASRFLAQSTFGADLSMIQELETMGIDAWITWQVEVPRQNYFNTFEDVIDAVWEDQGNGLTEFPYFRMAWWQNVMTGNDYLRDRVAFALSEIFVLSNYSDLANLGEGLASYYDMLHAHALGNFRDLLYDVTLHPSMGLYLSHLNNPKSDTAFNQFPDENYAREAMQLFTIGLTILESDGQAVLDVYGNEIATYDNEDILEFSKIYTGLGFDAENAKFGSRRFYDFTVPMIMYENFHEPGIKNLLNGFVVQDGQSGLQDIEDAIDNLFYHPNVGPFIGRRLIQRLVKSNPTPAYLSRVSAVFDDNGFGVRGDLAAVVKAILTDPEARDCEWIDHPHHGKLREPIVRYTQFLRSFNAFSPSGTFYTVGNSFHELTLQAPLASPSVFNFFSPDYIPQGPAGGQKLFGPEFQILNSYTAIGYYNMFNYLKENNNVMQSVIDPVQVDFSAELAIALNSGDLIDHLDLLLSHGTMTEASKLLFQQSIEALPADPALRLEMAIYLFFTSPEFVILK